VTEQESYDRAIRRGTETLEHPEILPATYGRFSTPFFRTCRIALKILPGLVEHVVSLHVASGGASEDNIQASRDVPLPFNEQAWDDGNEMYRRVVYWTGVFNQSLSGEAPGPAKHAWRNSRGKVIGLPASATPTTARLATYTMTSWLLGKLQPIMSLDPEDVTLFSADLKDVFRVNARWPQKDRAIWSRLPCPYCQGRLALYPPPAKGGPRHIECETCGNTFTEAEYESAVKELERATKIAQHLAKKYARNA
jgi:hypothetical protein